ncbi:hypothetical protein BGZ54_008243 [Gamsiella multidivaricata]|nr:hypothetical protein BGZ54_008243 [Gamsiella multidivaricata]
MSPNVALHGPLPKIPEGSGKLKLGALVFDGADLLDIMGPMRIFGEELNTLDIEINFIGLTMKPARTSQQGFMSLIKPRIEASTWCMTVCTGAGILAKTGLIDGYNATTNKSVFEWAACEGPNVAWIKRARWVQDGKFVTSSGVSAGIDAALYILSELTSLDAAEKVAIEIEYTWHRVANVEGNLFSSTILVFVYGFQKPGEIHYGIGIQIGREYSFEHFVLRFDLNVLALINIPITMEQITELQNSTINFILVEKTKSHWHDFPELASLIESLQALQEPLNVPSLQYLLELARLACQADAEQSNRLFLRLESYFAVAEPPVVAHVLATLILEGGEGYPFPIEHATGWLAWALDYKPELARKGQFVKRLWRAAEGRREEIESLAVQRIVSTLIKKQQEQRTRLMNKDLDATNRDGGANRNWAGRYHDIIYMLHCGPLADQGLQLWDEESVLNALVRIRDGSNQRAFENQLLILVNLLDRLFSWIESKDVEENKEQLKQRVALYTKTPELLAFAIDTVVAYLDGRWIKGDIKEDGAVRSKTLSTSLLDINREREPIHYATTDAQGSFGFSESKNAIRGRSLKEREIPQRHDRGQAVREFEIVDLVARCMEGHDSDVYEQLLRRLMLHIAMQVDTVMISATAAAMKHAAQQR